MPKVSIIIPCHNPPKEHIYQSLESVFNQTFQDFEIIVVDDGSDKVDAKEVLKPYLDRIQFFRKENGGANSARLLGFQHAKGDYIALVDEDDLWVPHKLELQVKFLDEYPDVDLIFSNFQNFNETGAIGNPYLDNIKEVHKISKVAAPKAGLQCKIFDQNILYEYLKGNFIIQCTIMARKQVCEQHKMFESKTFGRELYEFGARSIHQLKIGYIDEVLAQRRIHGNNITLNMEKHCTNTITICQDALKYPWMDERCKQFLQEELQEARYLLGKYCFVKGRYHEARGAFQSAFRKDFHLRAYAFWVLSYIVPISIMTRMKRIKKDILAKQNYK